MTPHWMFLFLQDSLMVIGVLAGHKGSELHLAGWS
ncbi:MAG: hypothetical protein JWP34_5003, partial [Massilia sp.]|nr:hypothetical protein [Massilia sp.]